MPELASRRTLIIRGSLLFTWCLVIFTFSQMPGSGLPFEPPLWYILERKAAHVFEYAILFWLALRFFIFIFPHETRFRITALAVVFSLSYGMLDELHQFFIFGRGARFSDVLVDLLGIGVGLVLIRFFQVRAR